MNNVDLTEINLSETTPDNKIKTNPTNARRKLAGLGKLRTALISLPFILSATQGNIANAEDAAQNRETASPTPITETLPSPNPNMDNLHIVFDQIEKLGIKNSPKEHQLWEQVFEENQITLAESDIEKKDQAMTIIQTAIEAMGKSENPYFADTYNLIMQLKELGLLDINADLVNSGIYGATTGLNIDKLANNNQVLIDIKFSPESVLNDSYAINLLIVHEVQHVKQWLELINSIPPEDLNGKTIAAKIREMGSVVERKQHEEAEAYGVEFQSYTYFVGQTSYSFDPINDDTAKLISCDFDPESLCWKSTFPANDPRLHIIQKEDQ